MMLKGFARDPVHEDEGQWWFWDETWADRMGPFVDEEAARKALVVYCDVLDNGVRQVAEVVLGG